MKPIEHLHAFFVNHTIASVELIRAEYGRTHDFYTCFVRSDGKRLMLASQALVYGTDIDSSRAFGAEPPLDEMRKAPNYFTPEDIAERVLRDELTIRRRIQNELDRKRSELERLKKELGES